MHRYSQPSREYALDAGGLRLTLKLRALGASDVGRLLQWANDPVVRANAFTPSLIPTEEHERWLAARLGTPTMFRIFIAEDQTGAPIGQIRFAREGSAAIIDYSIDRAFRGRGLAPALLRAGTRRIFAIWPDIDSVTGQVKPDNIASVRSFLAAGFSEEADPGGRRFSLRREDRHFVIAASRSWYRGVAERLSARVPGKFSSVSVPNELTFENLSPFHPEWVFFPHWSTRIPKNIHEAFPCVVFHMTALPYGRGGSPLQNLIARGHRETVISAIVVTDEIDAGDIYLQRPLSLSGSATEIMNRAAAIIETMIAEMIETDPIPVPQTGEPVRFVRRVPAESALNVDMSLDAVYDHIRMLDAEGYPRAFLEIGSLRFEFTSASHHPEFVHAEVRITPRADQ